ncbi:hypothetical protein BC937DRAFT_88650 [Endogone sp. FLAS-F59071]|nr:hypothetical protein BC937DRAFT_88650 [Endogone sp. FLAS-F59071]|eukprot:RUS18530.1 hypothetical protein BC937DRAFT_88650 [Endogone sp. FLAS-F59071]
MSSTSLLSQFSLTGKTAVVTGGARGLGLEMMDALAEVGASVACVDVLADLGKQSAEGICSKFGVLATSWSCDVTNDEQVRSTFDAIAKLHGSIDVLVTAAGVVKNVPAEQYPAADFKRLMDINVNGTFFCAQAAGNHMITQSTGGSIILIASMSGSVVNRPQPQCAYNASKAAVIMLAKSLAAEWAPNGIRVNSLSPGESRVHLSGYGGNKVGCAARYMETDLTKSILANEGAQGAALRARWESHTPIGRMGQPHELKATIVYLASRASSFVTGSDLIVDGGYTAW